MEIWDCPLCCVLHPPCGKHKTFRLAIAIISAFNGEVIIYNQLLTTDKITSKLLHMVAPTLLSTTP